MAITSPFLSLHYFVAVTSAYPFLSSFPLCFLPRDVLRWRNRLHPNTFRRFHPGGGLVRKRERSSVMRSRVVESLGRVAEEVFDRTATQATVVGD